MTKQQKIDRIVHWLTYDHLYAEGGYPYDWAERAGWLFIATLDHQGATCIDIYEVKDLPGWYDEAVAWLRKEHGRKLPPWPKEGGTDFGAWAEALWETDPRTAGATP